MLFHLLLSPYRLSLTEDRVAGYDHGKPPEEQEEVKDGEN